MAFVKLRHKTLEGLKFGPNSEIKFGLAGGFAPGELVIDDQDPLYSLLWELEGPNLDVVPDGPARVYASPIEPGREFNSQAGLLAHVNAAAKKGDELAKAWLLRMKGRPDALPSTPEVEPASAADVFVDPDETAPGESGGVHRSRDGVVMQDPVSPPVITVPR